MLTITTTPEKSRSVGGGLDTPAVPVKKTQKPTPPAARPRCLALVKPVVTRPVVRSECDSRPARRRTVNPTGTAGGSDVLGLAVLVDELAVVRRLLAEVVTAPHADATAAELACVAVLKLAGHQDCAEAWNPSTGSMDGTRRRCVSFLSGLPQPEAAAVVSLLTTDFVGGA